MESCSDVVDYRVSQAAFSLSPSYLHYAGHLLAVDRPGYAELIDKRAKADGPEGFLQGHFHRAVFRKRVKYPICFRRVIDAKLHSETLWLFILLGNRSPPIKTLSPTVRVAWRIFSRHLGGTCSAMGDLPYVSIKTILPPKHRS
jgi:hypothetical protein